MHYVACMGCDDNPALRAVFIVDSGFWPKEYWITVEQVSFDDAQGVRLCHRGGAGGFDFDGDDF